MSQEEDLPLSVHVGELVADKYRVDRILGAGGMGVVVAATHLDLDRPVAIKLMREELLQDESAVQRLLLEARSAAKIRSEHVAKVLDVGTLPSGAPYIVMEFLHGGDLAVLLETSGALPPQQAVDFVLEACEALAEAHAANIIHRDLKPENLFVAEQADGSPSIKVVDFGISKHIGADAAGRALTNPSTAVGSPHYMAPEQMQAREVDQRVDIWAIGVILYELITGRKAFDGDTLPAVCALVLGQQPPPITQFNASVPGGLQDAILRCLNKDRDQRYSDIAELVMALAPYGSPKAQISLQRVTRVLRGPGSQVASAIGVGPTVAVQDADKLASGATVRVETPANTGPQAWQSTQHSSPTGASRRGLVVTLSVVAVVLAAAIVFLLASMKGEAPADVAEATPSSEATPASPVPSEPPPAAPAVTVAEDTKAPADEGEDDSKASEAEAEPKTATPAPKPKPRPAVRRPKTKSTADPTQAWDPDSFGGRE